MLHKTSSAETTVTDLREFTAIAAAYTVDRQNEQIKRGAFVETIKRWRLSGKQVPVHWNHEGQAANVIGSIDPSSMRETTEGLRVKGQLDLQESEVAREAWRSMKANRVALSFGYMVNDQAKRQDGVTELRSIDLFEISIVSAPANPDTRFLSMKGERDAPKTIAGGRKSTAPVQFASFEV
jgi:HK97 family phage prohead protease